MTHPHFSHLDADGAIHMVNISAKTPSARIALASAEVRFPADVYRALRDAGGQTKKGSITDTAHIAAIMGAKKTSELIPLCHPLPLDGIDIDFAYNDAAHTLTICASVHTTHKTGVEMEALTAVSIAALTIYDMTKAMSHAITIGNIRLLEKTGGKSDLHH